MRQKLAGLCSSALALPSRNIQGWANVLFKRTQRSYVLLKRTLRSLRSFTFFAKERCVLCSFWFHKSPKITKKGLFGVKSGSKLAKNSKKKVKERKKKKKTFLCSFAKE